MPGGNSLAKLIGRSFNVRNQATTPRLTVRQVLAWADAHHARTGNWPQTSSGVVDGVPSESWREIDNALRQGHRGLKGGSSLYRVLKQCRRIPGRRTKLVRDVQGIGGNGRKPTGAKRKAEGRARAVELRQQGLTFLEIGQRLGVTKQRAEQLVNTSEERSEPVRWVHAHGQPWTAEEDELVRTLPAKEVAEQTGRTLYAVYSRRVVLGLLDARYRRSRE